MHARVCMRTHTLFVGRIVLESKFSLCLLKQSQQTGY